MLIFSKSRSNEKVTHVQWFFTRVGLQHYLVTVLNLYLKIEFYLGEDNLVKIKI
jgi:hypothetical protein